MSNERNAIKRTIINYYYYWEPGAGEVQLNDFGFVRTAQALR